MTEAEWLACDDPTPMLEHLRGQTTDRRLILFSLACWTTSEWYGEPDWVEAITEMTNAVLDGQEHLARLICLFGAFNFATPPTAERWAAMVTQKQPNPTTPVSVQVSFLRDILDNPFRPVTFDPAWRTDTAVSLASQMYDSRDFSLMPILADALQDAGCADAEILAHCRGSGPHVRGCWVVDLVLGKQ